jgi:SAM-dependent MidA family methyltransferase
MSDARPDRANRLLERLRDTIARDGPMPVDRYMQVCLADPEHGYWQRAATLGGPGDFVTAPEISQVFGELIGIWSALAWQRMGRPAQLRLIELGPGRGTLMHDALRAGSKVSGFRDAATVHLVEVSRSLREVQRRTLAGGGSGTCMVWHERLADVPPGPAVLIANEFLDALPIRQLIFSGGAWHERVVRLAADGGLELAVGPPAVHATFTEPLDGTIVELRAGEDELLATLAARGAPVAGLFIDYGPAEPAFGDTLQAVRRHAYADPLAEPGGADLTAHVQFSGLAEKARKAGFTAHGPLAQAEFLGRMGATERATRLMAANPKRAGEIEPAVQRLMSPAGMGSLFKALAVCSPSLSPLVPFG